MKYTKIIKTVSGEPYGTTLSDTLIDSLNQTLQTGPSVKEYRLETEPVLTDLPPFEGLVGIGTSTQHHVWIGIPLRGKILLGKLCLIEASVRISGRSVRRHLLRNYPELPSLPKVQKISHQEELAEVPVTVMESARKLSVAVGDSTFTPKRIGDVLSVKPSAIGGKVAALRHHNLICPDPNAPANGETHYIMSKRCTSSLSPTTVPEKPFTQKSDRPTTKEIHGDLLTMYPEGSCLSKHVILAIKAAYQRRGIHLSGRQPAGIVTRMIRDKRIAPGDKPSTDQEERSYRISPYRDPKPPACEQEPKPTPLEAQHKSVVVQDTVPFLDPLAQVNEYIALTKKREELKNKIKVCAAELQALKEDDALLRTQIMTCHEAMKPA